MHSVTKTHLFKLKPVGLLDRLLSALLIAFLLIGQPAAVVRVLAQEVPAVPPNPEQPAAPARPAVWGDQGDYAPGSTMLISAVGFQTNEIVVLQVLHADGTPSDGEDHQPWAAVANESGAITSAWHVCEDDCVGSTLMLSAVGQSSGATASFLFTDSATPISTISSGSLWSWGAGESYQIGNTYSYSAAPTPLSVAAPPAWNGKKPVSIAAGGFINSVYGGCEWCYSSRDGWYCCGYYYYQYYYGHSLAVLNDGTVWGWGDSRNGQIGIGSYSTVATPQPVVSPWASSGKKAIAVSANSYHSLFMLDDGSVWGTGNGSSGQLGTGAAMQTAVPVPVAAPSAWAGKKAVALAAGLNHSVAALDDGSVWAWGYNYYGQLGDGTAHISRTSPVQVVAPSAWVGKKVIAVAAGAHQTLFLLDDGRVWGTGNGQNGELGTGAITITSSPVPVAVPAAWAGKKAVALASGYHHSLALLDDGSMWGWGNNYYGQLGDATTIQRFTPVQVAAPAAWAGKKVVTIAGGLYQSLAALDDGSAWGWGYNLRGAIGNGTYGNSYSSPVPVTAPSAWAGQKIVALAAGEYHTLAVVGVVNRSPVAANDGYSTPEDGVLTVPASGVLANDSDPDGDALTVTSATTPAHGTLSMNADGSFTYTPVANYNGPDSFNYTIADGKGGTASATVTITVTAMNDAPVANAQSVSTSEDTAKPIMLTGSDVEGSSLTYNIVVSPAHGTLGGSAPNVTYTPAANYNGPDSFTFKVNDGTVDSAPATVSINVTAVNDGPVAVNDSYNLGEDMILSLVSAASGVLANDSDVDANTLAAVLVGSPAHGSLTLQPDGRFTYTPVADFNGPDTFTYRVNDGVVDSAIATVTINVIPVNDGPQLTNPGNKMINELDSLAFTLSATDVDLPTDTLTYAIASGGESGMTLDGSSGAFAWTPTEAQGPGVYTMTFRVTDLAGVMSEQTITTTVSEVNVVPTITDVPVEATIPELVNFTFDASGSDPDAPVQSLTYSLVGAPTGAMIDATTGVFSWTPAEDQGAGDYAFAIRISDGVITANAPIVLHVTEVNVAPVANDQTITSAEDTALGITLTGSDADLPVNILSYSVVSGPAHGTLSGTPPSLTYTPAANYYGPDSFTFKANDGAVDSAVATVSITVNTVNDGPQLASPGDKLVNELEPLAFTLSAKDVDLPADTLTYAIASGGESGMVLDAGTGAFVWTPTEAQGPGAYTVAFRVTDLAGAMSAQTIIITVSEVNVVPTITDVPAEATIPELVNFTFDASGSDLDAPVQSLTFSLIGASTGATIDATTGVFNWTPAENQGAGDYTFAVRISDGVTTVDAPIILHVIEVNVAPALVSPGNQMVNEETVSNFVLSASDADLPANTLAFSIASGAQAGMTLDSTTGAFAWIPTEAQGPGSYAVTFRVTDAGGLFDEKTITITVNELNTAPLANGQTISTEEDTSLAITLTASDVDLPPNALAYLATSGPSQGSLSGTAPNLTYTPNANFNGTDSFTFQVNDGAGNTASATISITITPVNDAPLANAQSISTAEDSASPVTLTGSDIDGDALTYIIVTAPAHGTLSGVAPNLTYTPAPNYFGADSFTFKVNDGTVDSAPAAVSITVTPVNDNPVANNDSTIISEDSGANVFNVLANDSIAPDVGETLAITGVTPAAHGTVTFTGTAVNYTPVANYFGPDSFTYTISDGQGGTAMATVSVTVNNVNDTPALALEQPSSPVINENGSVSVSGQVSDADPQHAHSVVINWGDGSAATTLTLAAGVTEFSASHQYLDDQPTGTPSDVYAITVTASDAAGATATDTTSVTVNNVAPTITSVTGPTAPLPVNSTATVTVNLSDVGTLDTHAVRIAWDDGTADTVLASGGFSRSASHVFTAAGVYTIAITVTDDDTGEARTTYEYIVIYDPNGGFVTGGGWIQSPAGAYVADQALSGKANFGFVSKYQKGATIPTGDTEFQLHFATFNFKSTSYQWLVVSGAKAQYKGSGTINGSGDYGFLLTATDGQINGGGGADKFRIKIWEKATGTTLYDNVPSASDDVDSANPQLIGGGSVSIKAK